MFVARVSLHSPPIPSIDISTSSTTQQSPCLPFTQRIVRDTYTTYISLSVVTSYDTSQKKIHRLPNALVCLAVCCGCDWLSDSVVVGAKSGNGVLCPTGMYSSSSKIKYQYVRIIYTYVRRRDIS